LAPREAPREREECGDPTCVVVGARCALHGVVVRAHDDDLIFRAGPRDLADDVTSLGLPGRVRLLMHLQSRLAKLRGSPIRRRRVCTRMADIALANLN